MLGLIGGSLLGPFTAFSLKAQVLTQAFRFTASLVNAEQREKLKRLYKYETEDVPPISQLEGEAKTIANLKWDFDHAELIARQNFLSTILGCNKKTRFKSMMAKAESTVT